MTTMIFCLSALEPKDMPTALRRIKSLLKSGGRILFRDYGEYDLAQVRFKSGQCIEKNFYKRGDGTRVFFFTEDYLKNLFESEGFVTKQLYVDRRMQVNRGKQLKMFRVWIQAQFEKP